MSWVDDVLLAGADDSPCLTLERTLDRAAVRELVEQEQQRLTSAGAHKGSTVALRLPPSLALITTLLAAWRLGAQVALLDVRLAPGEVATALERLRPQFLVESTAGAPGALRGFSTAAETVVTALDGLPAATDHALLQLSSGSTGPSKVIGRSAADLTAEIERYTRLDGFPQPGERVVVLASIVHVLGLVGGLLHTLHRGAELVLPARTTVDGIRRAIGADLRPTTVLGAPVQAEILASAGDGPELPGFKAMITGGDAVGDRLWKAFTERYGATLGSMYGMTEVGVIATDLRGAHRPQLAPAPGMELEILDGQILIRTAGSPYVGLTDPTRWVDGLLRTKDAGTLDRATGLLTVHGRMDSQVSIGGLKVDLLEVERTLAELPGVADVVVVHDRDITAYLTLTDPAAEAGLTAAMGPLLAPYKRPRALHVLPAFPRTATGKPLRDPVALRSHIVAPTG
ncbi:class I adenylate-forming enzyme family protein [Kitasatospora viridis]|uniref:Acyl-CoA synthetase (AMP-forming)/AMP-acid ligase II n=1 Tax=Kitasatospora viridis TaxID=281105 RepID=A0A561UIT3_9ACTN|nr:class I adenylate-forming enzyme family protein [Kitasatospora viridis]TWF99265.1 acyl-CoA synthetase (AMP-forming)/AMP-acid ligase II [Kitasatospora viridis]